MRITVFALALLPTPCLPDVAEAVNNHILPATKNFATAANDLAQAAKADCTAAPLRPHYQTTFDAWMGLSHLAFGPLEQDGRALTVEFWPDPRGMVGRTVRGMVFDADPVVDSADSFPEVSVAGRGLMALEQLLYDDDQAGYTAGDYSCRYVRAIAFDLANIATAIKADWQDHAKLMLSAGESGNARYLSASEASQVLYTALLTTIEFNADQRLGRPMGTFDRPRPNRAEAYRSGRPLQNIILSLRALRELALTMSDRPLPKTELAFDTAITTARELDDPLLAGVADPHSRLKIEILQQQIRAVGDIIQAEIGGGLGLTAGFNSKDGD